MMCPYNISTVRAAADLSQACNALHRLLQQGLDDQVCHGSLLFTLHRDMLLIQSAQQHKALRQLLHCCLSYPAANIAPTQSAASTVGCVEQPYLHCTVCSVCSVACVAAKAALRIQQRMYCAATTSPVQMQQHLYFDMCISKRLALRE